MEAEGNVGVEVYWIDRVIGRILKARDHHRLIQSADSIRVRMEDMQKQLVVMADELKRVEI